MSRYAPSPTPRIGNSRSKGSEAMYCVSRSSDPAGVWARRATQGPKPIHPPYATTAINSDAVTTRLRRARPEAERSPTSASKPATSPTRPPRLSVNTSATPITITPISGR